jgi:hypothetical protein
VKYHITDTREKRRTVNKPDTLFIACGKDDDPVMFAAMYSANLMSSSKHEVDPWVGHQIGLELIDIDTKSTIKSQGRSQ